MKKSALGSLLPPVLRLLAVCLLPAFLTNPAVAAPVTIRTVETGTLGAFSSQLIVAGNPALSYSRSTVLRYARNTAPDGSGTWTTVTVDPAGGGYSSMCLVAGNPAIAYYRSGLRFARCTTADGLGSWTIYNVDVSSVSAGYVPSMVVSGGNPAIAYYESGPGPAGGLKFARASTPVGSGAWSTVNVESSGAFGGMGQYLSMAIVSGAPCIAYYDQGNKDLRFARALDASGSFWSLGIVESAGDVGDSPQLAVINGLPSIAYTSASGLSIRYARSASASGGPPWTIINAVSGAGFPGSLSVVNGRPAISYGSVGYARASDASGTAWNPPITLDSSMPAMDWYTSLAMVAGRPAVSYSDFPSRQVRWARLELSPGEVDDVDSAIVGTAVNATAEQADGKVLVGGHFTSILGSPRNNLARLNADGTLDASFDPALAGYDITCIAVQDDGKIVVGGNLLGNNLRRLNPDGTPDPTFVHFSPSPPVCLAIQSDGKVLAGGYFLEIDGIPRLHIARFNPDGTPDLAFTASTNHSVFNISVQRDGKILLGGEFSAVNGVPRSKLARLNADGTLDTAFNPGVTGNFVDEITVQHDDNILLGGDFTAVAGTARSNLARLLSGPTGALDTTYNPVANGVVRCAALQADGDVIIGGSFTAVSPAGGGAPVTRNRIVRLLASGAVDPVFNPDADNDVYSLAARADGKVYAGGLFTKLDGLPRNLFARLFNDPAAGSLTVPGINLVQWMRSGTAPEAQHVSFELSTDGGLTYLPLGLGIPMPGGWHLSGLSLPRDGIIRARARILGGACGGSTGVTEASVTYHNPVEDIDLAMVGSMVTATAQQPDGKTLVAGNFTSMGGVALGHVGRFKPDKSVDATFDPHADNIVNCVAVQNDGKILLGGDFHTLQPNGAASPTARRAIARVNPDGSLDTTFHPVLDGRVISMAIQTDGEILICGSFTLVDGIARNRVARLHVDGSLDLIFDPNANADVQTMAVQEDGKVLLGGDFSQLQPNGAASPAARQKIGRVNYDGSLDAAYTNPDITMGFYVYNIRLQTDGKALVSGFFQGPGGLGFWTQRFNDDASGSHDATFSLPPGYTYSQGLQADGKWIFPRALGTAAILFTNPDGSRDPLTDVATAPEAVSVDLQPDGKILLGGSFTSIAGVPRSLFARLDNAPATDILTVGSSDVQWMRGGSTPESFDVTFDLSTDGGLTYSSLGTGYRIPGGWEIAGLTFPSYGQVRARARTISGFHSGSSGIVENIKVFGTPPGLPDPLDLAITGSHVWAIAIQPDGKTIIGGQFGSVLGTARNNIARINADGTLDTTFNPDVTGGPGVYNLALQADGKVVIGGYFTTVGGFPRFHMARVNADGTLDFSYDPHPDNPVYCMAAQPDGKILIGGAFSTVGGAARTYLARLLVSGTADPGFLSPGPTNFVTSLALQGNGDVVFGGYFTGVGTAGRNHVARVNSAGSIDSYNPNVTGSSVFAIAIQADGDILLGGSFTAVGGNPRRHLARTRITGVIDPVFSPAPNDIIHGITLQADTRILISGGFTTLQPGGSGPLIPRRRIARLNSAGTVDVLYNPDANGFVNGSALQADGKVLLGGDFSTLSGLPRLYFARTTNEAAIESLGNSGVGRVQWLRGGAAPEAQSVSFDLSTDGGVTFSPLGQGTRIAGGWELTGLSLPSSGILRGRARTTGAYWNGSGGLMETIGIVKPTLAGSDASVVGRILTTVVQPDGKVILAGEFTSILGVPRQNVARLNADGTLDMAFTPTTNHIVNCAAVQADGKILLGGVFTMVKPVGEASDIVMNHLVRLEKDGRLDYTYIAGGYFPNPDAQVTCMAIQPDGKLLLGGDFNYIAGEYHLCLARLNADGTPDAFEAGINSSSAFEVTSLARQPDGKVVFTGYFDSVGGQPRNGIARVFPDGTLDPTFDPNCTGYPLCVALQADGKVLVGGLFTAIGGTPRRNFARLLADGTLDAAYNPSPDDAVWTICLQADGKSLFGGVFTNLQPGGSGALVPRKRITRLKTDGTPDPDFTNPDVNAFVASVALAADGKVWIGGQFTSVDSVPRSALALLTNGPATERLAKAGASGLEWKRGGTAPEAADVSFEVSTDGGIVWSPLGNATRIAGGWQRSRITIPAYGTVRARARTAGCFFGSSGLVESRLDLGPLPPLGPSYGSWISGFYPTAPSSYLSFTADPDNDGLANGIEFYLGLNPSLPNVASLNPVLTTEGYVLTYARLNGLGAHDASAVQWSNNLITWTSQDVTTTVIGPADTTHETVRATVPLGENTKLFIRVISEDQ